MRGQNPSLLSCELHNPYQAIDASNNIRHTIKDVVGQPLLMGIFVDAVTDIGRIENVHFHASIFSFALADWQMRHGTCFKFGRSDWQYVFNTFCWGWRVGYHFVQTSSGATNGNFLGIGADMVAISVLVEETQIFGVLITNGEFTAFDPGPAIANLLDVPVNVLMLGGGGPGPHPGAGAKVSFVNCAFWGKNDVKVNVSATAPEAVLDVKDSLFFDWAQSDKAAPAIVATGGSVTVTGCEFRWDAPQVSIGKGVHRAIVTSNLVVGKPRISIAGGPREGEVVVANNAGAALSSSHPLMSGRHMKSDDCGQRGGGLVCRTCRTHLASSASDEAECCAACSSNASCVGYNLHANSSRCLLLTGSEVQPQPIYESPGWEVGSEKAGCCGVGTFGTNTEPNCNTSAVGSWNTTHEGILSLAQCKAQASSCAMAGFVSFSLTHEDCSWYAGCSMMAVGGYESARLKPPIALRSGLPAPPVVSIVPDWRNATVTTHTTPTLEIVYEPFMSRGDVGGPFSVWQQYQSELGADFARFGPWYTYPSEDPRIAS